MMFIHGEALGYACNGNRFKSLKIRGRVHYRCEKILASTINFLWDVRLRYGKDSPMGLVAKLIGNSLFGGFGRKNYGRSYFTYRNDIAQRESFGETQRIISIEDTPFGDSIYVNEYNPNYFYQDIGTLVRISSYIMCEARTRLFTFIHSLPADKVLYCDTDSVTIVCDGTFEIDPKFLDEDVKKPEIGKFGIEAEGDYHIAVACKMRVLGKNVLFDGEQEKDRLKISTKGIGSSIRKLACNRTFFENVLDANGKSVPIILKRSVEGHLLPLDSKEEGASVDSTPGRNFRRYADRVDVKPSRKAIKTNIRKRLEVEGSSKTIPHP